MSRTYTLPNTKLTVVAEDESHCCAQDCELLVPVKPGTRCDVYCTTDLSLRSNDKILLERDEEERLFFRTEYCKRNARLVPNLHEALQGKTVQSVRKIASASDFDVELICTDGTKIVFSPSEWLSIQINGAYEDSRGDITEPRPPTSDL